MSFLITSTINALRTKAVLRAKFINFKQSCRVEWFGSAGSARMKCIEENTKENKHMAFIWVFKMQMRTCITLNASGSDLLPAPHVLAGMTLLRFRFGGKDCEKRTQISLHIKCTTAFELMKLMEKLYCATKFIASKHVWRTLTNTHRADREKKKERRHSFRHHLMSWFIFST